MKHPVTVHKRANSLLILLFIIGGIWVLSGCSKEEIENPTSRTILVYMLANNDLGDMPMPNGTPYHFDEQNINDMLDAATDNGLKGGNLIVYRDSYKDNPQLIKIESRSEKSGKKVIVKDYPSQNSATPEVLREVIHETVARFPANEYGLILWAHSTGWVPNNSSVARSSALPKGFLPTRSFGPDGTSYLELDEIAHAIPDGQFLFILNDACFTGGVEQAYQLRNKCRYFIGSSAEVIGEGMPYGKTIPLLFETPLNLTAVCQTMYSHYNNKSGQSRTATVSLIDCNQLDYFAETAKSILNNHPDELIPQSTSNIQSFDRKSPLICFDLKDYYSTFTTENEITLLEDALSRTVLYQAATPQILSYIDIKAHCGLTTYILGKAQDQQVETYYKSLDWYRRVYSNDN